jgi:cysteine synthase
MEIVESTSGNVGITINLCRGSAGLPHYTKQCEYRTPKSTFSGVAKLIFSNGSKEMTGAIASIEGLAAINPDHSLMTQSVNNPAAH